jgi:AcrR family transcriptional regulator
MGDNNEKDFLNDFLNDQTLSEEEISSRQWQIIDAAIKIFSEKGFEGSRTSDIAREAEIAEGTIFRYYKTKKDLLLGLLFPMLTKFFKPMLVLSVQNIMNNEDDRPIDEVITRILLDRLELVRKNLPLVKTILIESFYHPELLKPIREDIIPKLIPFIDKFAEDNTAMGRFRDIDPRVVGRTMLSLLIGYVVLTSAFPDIFASEEDEVEMKRLADLLLHGIGGYEGNTV